MPGYSTVALTVPSIRPKCDVIIVEDDSVSRRALLALVASQGFAARAFRSAEEALWEVEREGVPNVVLVDLHLPGMNGMDFIRHMERASATVLPVLITAAGPDVLDPIRRAHPVRYLQKPLEFWRLVSLLNERSEVN